MHSIFALGKLIIWVTSIIFGSIVIWHNPKNRVNQTGFLLSFATALWAFGYWRYLAHVNDPELALFWVRILSLGSLFIPVFYYHWIISLLGLEQKKYKLFLIVFYLIAICCLFFSFSPVFVKEVVTVRNFKFWPQPGRLYDFYLLFVYIGAVGFSWFLLFSSYRTAIGAKRGQIKYVLLGSILGFGGGFTNFFLWYGIDIMPFGTLLVGLYPIIFSYAIVRHRLMDIKVVLRESSVYIFSLISVILGVLLIRLISLGEALREHYLLDLVTFIFAVSLFPLLQKVYYTFANRYLFTSLYDSQEVIKEMSNELTSTLESIRF